MAKIAVMDLSGTSSDSSKRKRAETLLKEVKELIDKRYDMASKRLAVELRRLSAWSYREGIDLFNKVFQVDIIKATLTVAELKALADDNLVLGNFRKEWWDAQNLSLKRRFAAEIRKGVLNGESNDQIISRIRGAKTGKSITIKLANGQTRVVPEYSKGVLQTSRTELDMLVRDSVQAVHNAAIMESYKSFDEVLRGYEAITTLDARTSDICIARTGASWDLEGNPLPESSRQEPFPGPPPWHHRCRTVLGPITKSWDEMVDDADKKLFEKLDTTPDNVRASFDGLVSNIKTFDDLLKAKGAAWAKEKLGPGRYELWKAGKITTAQLIDQSGRSLTIKELQAL